MTAPGGGSSGGGDLGTVRGKIVLDAAGATKGAEEAERAVDKLTTHQEQASKKLAAGAATAAKGLAVGVAGGLALAINSAKDFEQSLANVAAAGGKEAAGAMDLVREKALQLGADTKFSATEAADAMEVLIKAGLSVADVLNGAADAAVNLAAAEGITIPEAAEIAAVAMTSFNLKASQMPDIANKISQAASATKMDVNDFSFAMNQAGAVSKLVGLSFEDMTLAITAMGKAGIVGSDAGTSLKTMLMNLQPSTKPAREMFNELGITVNGVGNKFFDAQGKVKSMTDIAGVLEKALVKLNPAQRQMALETMFGSDAIRAGAIIAEKGAKGMRDLTAEMGNQLSVAEKAKVKQDTLNGAIEKLQGSVETAGIKLGTVFIPVIRDLAELIERVANGFGNLPKPMQELVAWSSVGLVGFIATVFVLKKIYDAFKLVFTALGWVSGALVKTATTATTSAATQVVAADAVAAANGRGAASALAAGAKMIAMWIKTAAVAMASAVRIAAAWVIALPIGWIIALVVGLIAMIIAKWDWFKNVFSGIWDFLTDMFGRWWRGMGNIIKAGLNFWKELFFAGIDGILAVLKIGFALLMLPVQIVIDAIVAIFKTGWDIIVAVFNVAKEVILGIISVFAALFTGNWEALWNGIVRIGEALWNFLGDIIKAVFGNIWEFLKSVWGSISDTFKSVWNSIVEWAKAVPGRVMGAIWGLLTAMWNFGRDLVVGLWEGISKAAQWLWDNIKKLGKGIADFFKNILGINSPSTVMRYEVGQQITYGVGYGMIDKMGWLQDQVAKVGAVIEPSVAPYTPSTSTALGVATMGQATLGSSLPAGSAASGTPSTIHIENLTIPIDGKLDPTDRLAWRNLMVAVKDGLRDLEREYS